jgi:multidrug efflux system outer membrane protein
MRQLEVLLGRYPAGTIPNQAELPEPLQAGLPSEVLERRPDIKAAFERLKAADYRVASVKKALLPRVTLTATGGTRSLSLSELADPRAAAWNFLMGLSQPLFTGGFLNGTISLQNAQAREALNNYRQTAESRKSAITYYQRGAIQILTLLDSYRSTLNVQSEYFTVRRLLINNRISLYLALGANV